MKHSRITIQNDNGQFASSLNKANRSLSNRIKKLKKEGYEISHSMMCNRIRLALIDAHFADDLQEIEIGVYGAPFNGIANYVARCNEYPVVFKISIDTEK